MISLFAGPRLAEQQSQVKEAMTSSVWRFLDGFQLKLEEGQPRQADSYIADCWVDMQ